MHNLNYRFPVLDEFIEMFNFFNFICIGESTRTTNYYDCVGFSWFMDDTLIGSRLSKYKTTGRRIYNKKIIRQKIYRYIRKCYLIIYFITLLCYPKVFQMMYQTLGKITANDPLDCMKSFVCQVVVQVKGNNEALSIIHFIRYIWKFM